MLPRDGCRLEGKTRGGTCTAWFTTSNSWRTLGTWFSLPHGIAEPVEHG